MGFTRVKVRIYNPTNLSKFNNVELLVDSNAIFSSIPREILERIDLKPIMRRKLTVYGGAIVERDTGVAIIEYEGNRAGVPIVFGEQKDIPVLGATSLEALGYKLNPITKRLEPVELLMI